MSIDMVNDLLDTMIVDPIDNIIPRVASARRTVRSLSNTANNLILKAASHYFPLDASPTRLETWATVYDHDQTHATRPGLFQFGCPGEENTVYLFDFMRHPLNDGTQKTMAPVGTARIANVSILLYCILQIN